MLRASRVKEGARLYECSRVERIEPGGRSCDRVPSVKKHPFPQAMRPPRRTPFSSSRTRHTQCDTLSLAHSTDHPSSPPAQRIKRGENRHNPKFKRQTTDRSPCAPRRTRLVLGLFATTVLSRRKFPNFFSLSSKLPKRITLKRKTFYIDFSLVFSTTVCLFKGDG